MIHVPQEGIYSRIYNTTERDAAGNVVKRFYEQGFQVVTGAQTENFYYTKDHLGSIREVVDSTTVVRARYDYDPWGRRTKLNGDVDADFGFTGFYHDTASGLDLTWYRAYSVEMGRWLSRDPLGEIEGENIYSYTHNSPIVHTDDLGLYCGTASTDRWIPDAPWGFDFSAACHKHDVCYGTCGKKKSECDVLFLVEMKLICRNNYGNSRACLKMADIYYRAVVNFGDTAYREAQEQACRGKKCK